MMSRKASQNALYINLKKNTLVSTPVRQEQESEATVGPGSLKQKNCRLEKKTTHLIY